MAILIRFQRRIPRLKGRKIRLQMEKVLKDLGCDDKELSILFTDDVHIATLNKNYLGREGPTNVLAFPMSVDSPDDIDTGMIGDVVISVDTAIRESEETGEDPTETIFRLLIHGVLHLFNYDHERSPEEATIMQREEKRLLDLVRKE